MAVTAGILAILNKDELEEVIGHELAHIRKKDILIGTMAATILSGGSRASGYNQRWHNIHR